jgi:hypothetical protein
LLGFMLIFFGTLAIRGFTSFRGSVQPTRPQV